jgi:hypothetical protein
MPAEDRLLHDLEAFFGKGFVKIISTPERHRTEIS